QFDAEMEKHFALLRAGPQEIWLIKVRTAGRPIGAVKQGWQAQRTGGRRPGPHQLTPRTSYRSSADVFFSHTPKNREDLVGPLSAGVALYARRGSEVVRSA